MRNSSNTPSGNRALPDRNARRPLINDSVQGEVAQGPQYLLAMGSIAPLGFIGMEPQAAQTVGGFVWRHSEAMVWSTTLRSALAAAPGNLRAA